jgi:hypothetical protein
MNLYGAPQMPKKKMYQFSTELSEFLEEKIKTYGYRTEKKKI